MSALGSGRPALQRCLGRCGGPFPGEEDGLGRADRNLFDGFGLVTDDATRAFGPEIVAALGLRMLA